MMVIIGAAGGGGFLILLIIIIVCCVKCKQKKKANKIPVNKVTPTDMTDFDQINSVPDYDSSSKKSKLGFTLGIMHNKQSSSTVRPMAVQDVSDLSRSFDYMINEEKMKSDKPARKG